MKVDRLVSIIMILLEKKRIGAHAGPPDPL